MNKIFVIHLGSKNNQLLNIFLKKLYPYHKRQEKNLSLSETKKTLKSVVKAKNQQIDEKSILTDLYVRHH